MPTRFTLEESSFLGIKIDSIPGRVNQSSLFIGRPDLFFEQRDSQKFVILIIDLCHISARACVRICRITLSLFRHDKDSQMSTFCIACVHAAICEIISHVEASIIITLL